MAKKPNFKDLCEDARAILKITTKAELYEALPKLIALNEAIKNMQSLILTGNKISRALIELCTKYAVKHPGCFDDGIKNVDDVMIGDITLDGVRYHLASGYRGFKRVDGGNLSIDFFAKLGEEYKQVRYELKADALKNLDDKALEKLGLKWGEHNVWTAQEEGRELTD